MRKTKESTDKTSKKIEKKLSKRKLIRLSRKERSTDPQKVRQDKFTAWVDTLPEFDVAPRTWQFWRDSFLIFMIGSFLGHVFEYILSVGLVELHPDWVITITPVIAEPFGFGMVAIMWTIYPLVKKHKIGTIGAYIAGAGLATLIEFVCAAVIVVTLGHNPYWDYSGVTRFNLYGFVCLHNALLFGVGAIGLIYSLYPIIAKWLNRFSDKLINSAAIILMVWYAASLACQMLLGFRLIL